jgi:hypothetical protein
MYAVLAFLIVGCSPSMGPADPKRDRGPVDDPGDTANDGGNEDTGEEFDWPDPVISCTAAGAEMGIEPVHPEPEDEVSVWVTADTGYVYIGMEFDPANAVEQVGDGAITGDGPYTWSYLYRLNSAGWTTFTFTADNGQTPICTGQVYVYGDGGDTDTDDDDTDSPNTPWDNPFGIGLVGPGNADQWDWAAELSGPGGHVKLIFPGVVPGMSGPNAEWATAVAEVYARDLVPVIRMNPPWGQQHIRAWSDDGAHRSYTTYAASFAAVLSGLPLREGWPVWIEVLNEPNLCYEWTCDPSDVSGGWLGADTIAAEYASLLRDVTAALRALGDPRIRIINGGLAPGGVGACECGTDNYSGGETSDAFIAAMKAEVPDVFSDLDGFASHAYPSSGEGWGFFEGYDRSGPGLAWWQSEVAAAGVGGKPVLITETGWTTEAGAFGSRADVAAWMLLAWQNDWFSDPRLEAVMPFQLQDGAWDGFSWIQTSGAHYPVFDTIRDWRCAMAFPTSC